MDESDPAAWKETLAILVTYATPDELASLCDSLATRLKVPHTHGLMLMHTHGALAPALRLLVL